MGEERCLCIEAFRKNKTEKMAPFFRASGREREKKEPFSFLGDACGESAQKAPISVISETQEW